MKNLFFNKIIGILMVLVLVFPTTVLATMTSTNYTIYADSVSVGGVGLTTSTNYSVEGTLGEPVAGISTSTGYEVRAGFQSMEREDLSLTLNTDSVSLGTLSDGSVSSANAVATVTSYALSGYSLSIGSVSGSIPDTVSDGAVTAGQDEYGFSVSGNDAAFSGDKAVSAGQVVASAGSQNINSATTLTFKASRSGAVTSGGTYSQAIVLLLSANF